MSATGRPSEPAPAASDVAAAVRDAGLVRIVATADGDALAATGLLARALSDTRVAFQASVTRLPRPGEGDGDADVFTEADVALTVGAPGGDVALTADPVSPLAYDAARELGAEPDPVLALAGAAAAGHEPGTADVPLEAARERGVDRRAGVAVPTADRADGLAHTTLAHAAFSGDVEAARGALSERDLPAEVAADPDAPGGDASDGRQVASLLALATARDGTPRAAEAVERALRPYAPAGPFATVGGYADVLDAVARERPGTGVALALGHEAREPALSAWRDHARRAHWALRRLDTGRYDGVVVARPPEEAGDTVAGAGGGADDAAGDGSPDHVPVGTVARLLRDFRSPEPVALVVAGGEAAAAALDRPVAPALREAARAVDAGATGRGTTGYAGGIDDQQAFVTAFRGAL